MKVQRTTATAIAVAIGRVGLMNASNAAAIDRKVSPLPTASTSLGTIVVDAKSMTVYEFAAHSKGRSTCTGSCLKAWPTVKAPARLPSSMPGITGKIGVLSGPDGIRQLRLNGLPLYTFAGDSSLGMTSGQRVSASGAKWWVVAPSGKKMTTTSGGTTTPGGDTPPSYDY